MAVRWCGVVVVVRRCPSFFSTTIQCCGIRRGCAIPLSARASASSAASSSASTSSVVDAAKRALKMNDAELQKECKVETMRGSGPGGQHRNKTESYVRYTHLKTGATGAAGEERSQALNRARALRRLRTNLSLLGASATAETEGPSSSSSSSEAPTTPPAELAKWLRLPGAPKGDQIGRKSRDYPVAVSQLLDVLVSHDFALSDASSSLGMSTGALSKAITSDRDLLSRVNQERQKRGIRGLKVK